MILYGMIKKKDGELMNDNIMILICLVAVVLILLIPFLFSCRKQKKSKDSLENYESPEDSEKLRERLWVHAMHNAVISARGKLR